MQEKGVLGELGLSIQHSLVVNKDNYQINMEQDLRRQRSSDCFKHV